MVISVDVIEGSFQRAVSASVMNPGAHKEWLLEEPVDVRVALDRAHRSVGRVSASIGLF